MYRAELGSIQFCRVEEGVVKKAGFTLVELMVVVAIMGILSAVGVASLRQAVMNNRTKDAALNTTAFLERVATDANKRSETLCLKKVSDREIKVYQGTDCSKTIADSLRVDSFKIDAPMKFVSGTDCSLVGDNWLDDSNAANALFKPKFGLSAAPSEGYVCVKYGGEDLWGAAQKLRSLNTVKPQLKLGLGGSWTDL